MRPGRAAGRALSAACARRLCRPQWRHDKYVRELCGRHGIVFDKQAPLQRLFELYAKFLQRNSLVESEMSERILKSSISVLDAFSDVRNNQSFAHDNPILNQNEAVLIFNDISNTLRFVESIERRIAEKKQGCGKRKGYAERKDYLERH